MRVYNQHYSCVPCDDCCRLHNEETQRLKDRLAKCENALRETFWLKLAIGRLLDFAPENHIVERDVNQWSSIQIMEEALKEDRDANHRQG